VASGQWLLLHRPTWLARPLASGGARALASLGRHSLLYYMLHQPVMIAALMLAGWVARA
jgi:uncharacterized membrane protein